MPKFLMIFCRLSIFSANILYPYKQTRFSPAYKFINVSTLFEAFTCVSVYSIFAIALFGSDVLIPLSLDLNGSYSKSNTRTLLLDRS